MNDIAVRIEHLSKQYQLGVINNGTLFRDIQTWIALKQGKEDPHSKIGENRYNTTEDSFWALKDISFDIKQGDRVGIIGKNGAGKSTLLKILSKITAPTEGSIKIKGRVASLLEVGTGFHGELTGRENIYLNGAILGMKKRRIDQLLDEIIAFSGIEHHIDTPAKRYSSGMYVRLAFAVAAHLDSDILIADEVLAVGDMEFQKKALGKMQELSTGQGRTVLFVSHNMGAVKSLCNTGVVLEKGTITYNGDIESVITAYSSENKECNHQQIENISIPELNAEMGVYIHAENYIGSFNPFSVQIIVNAKQATPNIAVRVMINHGEYGRIFVADTMETANLQTNINIGYNKFVCQLPKLLLAAGTYSLGIGLLTLGSTRWYYQNEDCLRFTVREEIMPNGRAPNQPYFGIIYISHEWQVTQKKQNYDKIYAKKNI